MTKTKPYHHDNYDFDEPFISSSSMSIRTADINVDEIPDFDLSLVSDEPTQQAKLIMEKLDLNIFIIEKYSETEFTYRKFIMSLFDSIKEGFEHYEFRYHKVMYKFRDDPNEEVKALPFNHFIVNCIFWYPCICLDPESLDEHLIVPSDEMTNISVDMIKEYVDTNYIEKYNRKIPKYPDMPIEKINRKLNNVLGIMTYLFTRTSADFCMFYGISSSLEIFIDLAQRYPEIDKIFHTVLDDTLQPSQLEAEVTRLRNELVKAIMNDTKFNSLKPLLAKHCGINLQQLANLTVSINMKPDIDGKTIAYPINTNYLVGGLSNMIYYYINAISGRKAAIINNEYMGKTGHLLNLIGMMCANEKISKTTMDCGSPNPVPFEIKTETHLNKMDGRRYRFAGSLEYHVLNAKKDKHLIGETIYVRSPITCCSKDGICRDCYGELYYTNIDNQAPGIFSATHVMNPVVQGILSAKHHQTTNTAMIKFQDEFYKFFDIVSTDIVLDLDSTVVPSEYYLVIRRDDIKTEDGDELEVTYATKKRRRRKKKREDDENEDYGNEGEEDTTVKLPYHTIKFEIIRNFNVKGKTEERFVFSDKDEKELYIHSSLIESMTAIKDEENGDYLYIPLEDVERDSFIFKVDVDNNELTKPMKKIQKILNNSNHEGCSTYQELINKMLDLVIESKLDAMSVHAEMIVRQLVRCSDNKMMRPNFKRVIMSKDYQLMTIGSALKTCPSILTSIITPYLNEQLVRLPETFKKTSTSIFDPMFAKNLDEYSRVQ